MDGKKLLDKLDLIDPEYIEAADRKPKKKPIMWQQWTALAACVTAMIISGTIMALTSLRGADITVSPGDTASLFSTGNVPLIVLTVSLLAAIGIAAVMIKNKMGK